MNEYYAQIVARGELYALISGSNPEFRIQPPGPAHTDSGEVFQELKPLITNDSKFRQVFMDNLTDLASDPVYGYIIMYYLFDLYHFTKHTGIAMITENFLNDVRKGLRANRETFMGKHEWDFGVPGGVWKNVQGLNRVLAKNHNLIVLPEEL